MYESESMLYYIYTYNSGRHTVWLIFTASVDLTDQPAMLVLNTCILYALDSLWIYFDYIPLILILNLHAFYCFHWWVIEYYAFIVRITFPYLITLAMALHMNNGHIRYFQMYATSSVGLVQSFFLSSWHIWSSNIGSKLMFCFQIL